jgi:LysR family transcriptional regulator, transcriptional activator of the cysJI operon
MFDYRVKTFLAVVEQGTLLKASETLGLTQSALSQHIKALEEHFSVPLFDHVGRRLILNEAGKRLHRTALQSEALYNQLQREFARYLGGRRHYRLGATLTIGEFILPSYLGGYRSLHPERELSVRIENTESVLHLLDLGKIDLALVEGPFDKSRYRHDLFLMDEMVFIGSAEYVPLPESPIGREDLKKMRLILRENGSGTRFYWEEYCRKKEIVLPPSSVIMEVGSLSAIKSLAEAGIGCSVMSRRAADRELALGTLRTRPFETGPLLRELHFVYTKGSPREFIEDFRAFARDYSFTATTSSPKGD